MTSRVTKVIWVVVAIALVVTWVILERNERNLTANRPPREPMQHLTSDVRPEVDETPVSEEEAQAWIVGEDRPRFLSIARLGIVNARVREVGLTANGEVGTPVNIFDVAWYRYSAKPGSGSGAMLITGHNGGPTLDGVFKRLGELAIGDEIVVERGDGMMLRYRVVENRVVNMEEAAIGMASMMRSAEPEWEGLNLITCTGQWVQSGQTFDHRVFLRAVLID